MKFRVTLSCTVSLRPAWAMRETKHGGGGRGFLEKQAILPTFETAFSVFETYDRKKSADILKRMTFHQWHA